MVYGTKYVMRVCVHYVQCGRIKINYGLHQTRHQAPCPGYALVDFILINK